MNRPIAHLGTEKAAKPTRFLVSAITALRRTPTLERRLDAIEARLEVIAARLDDISRRRGSR
jgi:hypothetical protein